MATRVLQLDPGGKNEEAVAQAVEALDQGRLVAFPTETVYGVGARADREEALDRLREVKGRTASTSTSKKPFTVHIGRKRDFERYVPNHSAIGRRLVSKGWPGPLTLVFTHVDIGRAPIVKEYGDQAVQALYHEDTIGLRCPANPVAEALLSAPRYPVVATSANDAGNSPACTAEEVIAELGDRVDLLLDGGRVRYSKPSTIVRLNERGYTILRTGVYDERTVRRLATVNILFVCSGNTCRSPMAAALCRRMLAEPLECGVEALSDHGVEVISAGTAAGFDSPASENAVEVMAKRGIELVGHSSQRVTVELIHRADRIFTMTHAHREAILRLVPAAEDRAATLVEDEDIEDPMGEGVEAYESCARRIEEALKSRLAEVEL